MISIPNHNDSHDDDPASMRSLSDSQQERLGELLEQYLSGLECGKPPTIDSLTKHDIELRTALRSCISGLEDLHQLAAGQSDQWPTEPLVISDSANQARRLGDYLLHEEIGRGGMGIVYRATQLSLHRSVAVKVLPVAATLDPRQLTRFRHEAEAAASLHHPHLIPVYNVGCESGTHFYVMQLIDGVSLDDQIDQSDINAPWEYAVRQAIDVARGLHAAHELGIIHRDVKPSNLIIDSNDKIWIGDFGLARIQSDVSLTQPGDVLGTMRYMSPEQARGQTVMVDGRSDVYSLGATLFEMLTGKPARAGEDPAEILHELECDTAPSVRQHRLELPRDLETVVRKAMSPDRDDRYETASSFADDLERVLDGKPTLARPPTLLDQCVRVLNRHRKTVTVIALLGILLTTVFAITSGLLASQNRIATKHAARAERNAAVARSVVDQLGGQVAELLRGIPAATSVRHRLLKQTLDYYEQLANDPADTHDLAITYGKIGELESELGLAKDAIESLQESEQIYRSLAAESPNDNELQLAWSIIQNNLARQYAAAGESQHAINWFASAAEMQTKLESKLESRASVELATTLNNLGQFLAESGNGSHAEEVFGQALSRAQSCESGGSIESTIGCNLAALLATSDSARSESLARQSLDCYLERLRQDPSSVEAACDAATTLNTIAMAQAAGSRHRDAIQTLHQSIEITQQLRSRFPEHAAYRRDLAVSLNHLGLSLAALGKSDRAVTSFQNASHQAEALTHVYPNDAEVHSMTASILNNLALVHQKGRNRGSAQRLYRQAIEHQKRAIELAPRVARYQAFLKKHRVNLRSILTSNQREVSYAQES